VRECAEDDGHKGHIFRIISHGPRRDLADWQERYPLGEKGGEGKEPQGRAPVARDPRGRILLAIEHETGRIVGSVDVDYRSKLFVRITLDSPNPPDDDRGFEARVFEPLDEFRRRLLVDARCTHGRAFIHPSAGAAEDARRTRKET